MVAQLREASSVIMLRRTKQPGFEVFLLRRRKGASFMASAYVFPGGGAEPGEDARTAAARELFEEAGVLLARMLEAGEGETLEMPSVPAIRKLILDGADPIATLAKHGLVWSTDVLQPWSHWITPSHEPRRFSARFFVCELPPGQKPRFDDIETVDQVWVTPAEAIARAKDLALPPPQVRTCWELAEHATIEDVLAAGKRRADEPHPILPRVCAAATNAGPCLLLPWDPDYTERGSGDAAPLNYRPAWARGPSRFVLEDLTWKHVDAPGSTSAG
ncbi:MAG: NUDIX hydrolase [Deltaproteobacteria bacterium]|nr:NUDIX hydrolase [Deltaproteobacteria bacterium]